MRLPRQRAAIAEVERFGRRTIEMEFYIGFAVVLVGGYYLIQWGKRKAEQQGREEAARRRGGDPHRPGSSE